MRFFRVRSSLGPEALRRALEDADALAISEKAAGSEQEVDLALHLAEDAFEKGKNIGRKLKYEFILWLAGKRDIKSAMEATAPGPGEDFFVALFSGGEGALEKIGATRLPLGLKKTADPLRLERISLSRIK